MECQSPKPGAKIKVIGAGLPRTATNSFCAAVSMLLDGPAYHVGLQYVRGVDDTHMLPWIAVMEDWPYPSPVQKKRALRIMEKRLDGYVGTADPPLTLLVPELMELYPDAVVVCTLRNVDAWAVSMVALQKHFNWALVRFAFFWLPNVRDMVKLADGLTRLFQGLFGVGLSDEQGCKETWDLHQKWLKEVVPKEKLFFVDMKDGWPPLCEALGVPVPEGVEFPRLNDSKAIDGELRGLFIKGLTRWLMVGAVITGVVMIAVAGLKLR